VLVLLASRAVAAQPVLATPPVAPESPPPTTNRRGRAGVRAPAALGGGGHGRLLRRHRFLGRIARRHPIVFAWAVSATASSGSTSRLRSTASGRYRAPRPAVDRLAADALVVLRPACHGVPPDVTSWPLACCGTIGVEVGAGYERDGRGAAADHRVGTRIGGRIELPLTPARDPSQLRLRIAARRLYAGREIGGAATCRSGFDGRAYGRAACV